MDIREYIQSGAIETYVLGLADPEEIQELEKLRLIHPEIQQAITDFEKSLEAKAAEHAVPVPADVKEKLFAQLNLDKENTVRDQELAPVIPMRDHVNGSGFGFARKVAVAAVVLLLGSLALNLYHYNKYRTLARENAALIAARENFYVHQDVHQARIRELQSDISLLSDTLMLRIPLAGLKGRENNSAVVLWKRDTKDVYLTANNLAPAPQGKQYQLWAIVDGKPVDAGVIGDCVTICKLKNITSAQAFAITLENAGGSPTPSDQMFVLGRI